MPPGGGARTEGGTAREDCDSIKSNVIHFMGRKLLLHDLKNMVFSDILASLAPCWPYAWFCLRSCPW